MATNELEQMDMTLKNLTLKLEKYVKGSEEYDKILEALYHQYQCFRVYYNQENAGLNNPYFVKYSDLDFIEGLLKENGYLQVSNYRGK